ncbi:putative ferric-chelate reductase 1 [Archocentrus centrarchus]|uniref:putative ferric-chelate reductase 1 n=1 Tax=Archocentrus centrarchus TaxID=63155 RepID=UPI0011E9BB29|nr:putative ferric-chelate reductase 1 [Archocentrus centrarchus]
MANRLVLTFLFVMLAGGFMGTYAQNTTASTNTTTAPANMTIAPANTTTAPANMTTAPANMTIAPANMTTAPANMTTARANATTAPANATTAPANSTTAPANATTAPANVTSATTAPPITPNSNVTNLTETISANNCSKTQLCARQPSDCDPTNGTCFFLGVRQLNGQNFGFALSGDSDGYIAAILSLNATLGNNDTTYICAKNNGAVKYFSAFLNNGKLTIGTLPVNNVRGRVNGNKIQCTFDATVPDSSKRAAASFSLSVATGSYNASDDSLGNPTPQITTNPVDLTNVTASTTNQLANTTTTTTAVTPTVTPNNAVTIQQSLMQALVITVGVLSLTML